MSGGPRILTIIGSGETSPTMVKVHRAVLDRLGPPPVDAVLLDTPFGFQENAKEIAARAIAYFDESLRTRIEVASGDVDGPGTGGGLAEERLVARVRAARYVFAGPGSPSYALRMWRASAIPQLLDEKLADHGGVTFASAAALTIGVATLPVYEIYKVGEDPRWLEGLDILGRACGLSAAVVPHYNNAEGGTHDTRFCYLGERRLAPLERELPVGAFVLGIDEHTSLSIDVGAGVASVAGIGVVTVRGGGRSATLPSGSVVEVDEIRRLAEELLAGGGGGGGGAAPARSAACGPGSGSAGHDPALASAPISSLVREHEKAFAAALGRRDAEAAAAAILALEGDIHAWSADIPGSDELDRARSRMRSMILELGTLAKVGVRDPAEVLGPFVEALLGMRRRAREAKRFEESDAIRDELVRLGVEVNDTREGTDWSLSERPGAGC